MAAVGGGGIAEFMADRCSSRRIASAYAYSLSKMLPGKRQGRQIKDLTIQEFESLGQTFSPAADDAVATPQRVRQLFTNRQSEFALHPGAALQCCNTAQQIQTNPVSSSNTTILERQFHAPMQIGLTAAVAICSGNGAAPCLQETSPRLVSATDAAAGALMHRQVQQPAAPRY